MSILYLLLADLIMSLLCDHTGNRRKQNGRPINGPTCSKYDLKSFYFEIVSDSHKVTGIV